jgi:hypothetical protein
MYSIPILALWLLLAFILFKAASFLIERNKSIAKANQLGCKPAPTFPSPDPLGIINVIKLIQSNNAGKLLQFVQDRVDTISEQEGRQSFTFQTHIVRNWLFFTCDPKNIQALLATQFKDFELGSIRFGTFAPLYVLSGAEITSITS